MAAIAVRALPVGQPAIAPPDRTSARVVILLVGLIGLFASMGVGSVYLFDLKGGGRSEGLHSGAAPSYAALPAMDFTLTDGPRLRMLRLKVLLEMDRVVEGKAIEHLHGPRIANALSARMVDVTSSDLRGADGTLRVKDAVVVEANRELRPARVRRVLLQEMLIQ